ncbi:MAG TPA: ABC transporter ATP-binding protein [Dehalococcoidia bacterium]|nr:ABC transporter ATP-binding protein [Dehalococcoidia bacterium]
MAAEPRGRPPAVGDTGPHAADRTAGTSAASPPLPMHAGTGVWVRELCKTYAGGVEALRGVSFEVRRGEAFGLLGPNGAGKSTTIGILTTTVRPTSGKVMLAGHDVDREAIAARRVSGIVFQDSVLDGALSGRANLTLHARLWGVPKDRASQRMAELIELMGLGEVIDRPARSFSGGQRRRLEIARAVLSDPQVLFLDEPTVGLDPAIRHELWALIQDLRARQGLTLLLTTHYLDEAERLCDRIAIMHAGRIVAMDSPANLLAALGAEVLEVDAAGAAAAVREALSAGGIPTENALAIGTLLTIPLQEGQGDVAVRCLRDAALPLRSIAVRRPTLDDVYLRHTGARLAA